MAYDALLLCMGAEAEDVMEGGGGGRPPGRRRLLPPTRLVPRLVGDGGKWDIPPLLVGLTVSGVLLATLGRFCGAMTENEG